MEAICELQDRGGSAEESIIEALMRLLDLNKLGDQNIEDAYSTIATGIEYIMNGDSDKLPFNLGGRFRNHAVSYQKVLLNTFQLVMAGNYEWKENSEELESMVKGKLIKLESVMKEPKENGKGGEEEMDRIRILQLTDWHITGQNTDDNLMLKAVKRYLKEIDLLLITGDLKQHWNSYDDTLRTLKQLTDALGLEPEDVFMVPGNHDCDDYADKSAIVEEIRGNIYSNKEVYRENLTELYQGFRAYEQFLDQFYGKDWKENGGLHNRLLTWKDKLNILCMNTALLCDKESDKPKIVDIQELSAIETRNMLPTICISHHKPSQIYWDHKERVLAILDNLKVGAMLSGDIHKSAVETVELGGRPVPNFICAEFLGAPSDQWSERSVAVYEIDLGNGQMTPHLYELRDGTLRPSTKFQVPTDDIDIWKDRVVNLNVR